MSATPYPIPEIIQIAKVCQVLASQDIRSQNFFTKEVVDKRLPRLLYMERSALEWTYNRNNSDPVLVGMGNYVYSLCKYVQQALNLIANSMGGGTIINPANGAVSTLEEILLQFVVGTTVSPVVVNGVNVTLPTAGQSSITLPLTFILNNSVLVIQDGVPLPIGLSDRQSVSVAYSNNNAIISLLNGATFQNGQLFYITAVQFVAI